MLPLDGASLSISKVTQYSKPLSGTVSLSSEPEILDNINKSHQWVNQAVAENQSIYGITTLFGGLADIKIDAANAAELQEILIASHHAGVGEYLAKEDVKAAMMVRTNSLARGASGVSLALLNRYIDYINHDAIPMVREYGSIGASGDLIPLATIAGAVMGLNDRYSLYFDNQIVPASIVLETLGLEKYSLAPKEGLALINGTSMMAGHACRSLVQFETLFRLNFYNHAIATQALQGNSESFSEFIHQQKPHSGQQWAAEHFFKLLKGSQSVSNCTPSYSQNHPNELIQDRYSIRCLPQFIGPIIEHVQTFTKQLTTEINSTTDNPIIDNKDGHFYHGGNFLGQHLSIGLDQLRQFISLLTKHMDAQIALMMMPEFSRGLPASLIGQSQSQLSLGLKPLQIAGNSILPLIEHLGNSIVDRFPVHAEQFNQNINSQGMSAALLSRQAITLWTRHLTISSIITTQAIDLRCHQMLGHYDARAILSEPCRSYYETIKSLLIKSPTFDRPLVFNDQDQALATLVETVSADLFNESSQLGEVTSALESPFLT